jgi:hypothetical protein
MRRGQVLIAAVFVLLIVGLLGLIAVSLISTESFSVIQNMHGVQALDVAEGGMRFTIVTSLTADSDWSDNADFGPVSLGPGSFSVVYIAKAKKNCSLEVTGTVQGVSRTVKAGFRGGGIPSQFSDYVGYGGSAGSSGSELLFNNNARCYGSLYYYGPVRFTSNAQQSSGTVYSTTIDPVPAIGIPDNYASWEAITTVEPVSFDPSYYNNWLAVANHAADDGASLTGGTVNLAGGTRYYGFINLNNGTINGPGTLCAVNAGARFRIRGNSTVNGNVRLISRGYMMFYPNAPRALFNASIEAIANSYIYMQNNTSVSRESIVYAGGSDGTYGIKIEDDTKVSGSYLAPNGVIRVMNNATLEGRVYAGSIWTQDSADFFGTSWVFLDVSGGSQIKDWSQLIQTDTGMPASLPPGLATEESSATFEVTGWQESF